MQPYTPGQYDPYAQQQGMQPPPGPGGYPGQPQMQPPGGAAPMTSPFGAAPGGGGGVISSPFGGGPPAGAPAAPPTSAFGGPPPMGGTMSAGSAVPPPPTSAQLQQQKDGFGPPAMGAPGAQQSPFGQTPGAQQSPFGGPPAAGGYDQGPPQAGQGGAAAANKPGFYPPQGGGGGYQPAGAGAGFPAHQTSDQQMQVFMKEAEQMNCPGYFLRPTVTKLPNSVSGKQKANLPMGVVLQPLAPVPADCPEVPSVNFAAVGTIVRCKNCRTYINPFVNWEANGRRWICNLCGFATETPSAYYSSLDEQGKRMDRYERPELSCGAVEYIAPGEYMVRPPQPPVFFFVIDVSYVSVVTGVLDAAVMGIKQAIQSQRMPGGNRLQIGIITYDSSIHFYNLNSNLSQPQMLIVGDLEDIFLPLPDDILVNARESESVILSLLDQLPNLFRETKINESCMGSAIKAAYMAMKHIGGKLLVFAGAMPTIGELALKPSRDNPRLLGTDREVELLRPANEQYKELATELTRAQISVELFVAPQQYVDVATISCLPKYTGGDVRYYPMFTAQEHGLKLQNELVHVLTRYMGWEAVMRVRVSRGWKITAFYGHLFIRGVDLLVVPNCHADQTFSVSIDMEENVTPDPILCIQSALLYTNCEGERRIRVQTYACATTQNFNDIVNSVDVQATVQLMSCQVIEQSLKSNLADGRNKLQSQCQQIVQAGNAANSEALQFLPLYIMGMLKSSAFRATNDISADLRSAIWNRLETMCISQLSSYFYPRMMALHALGDAEGVQDETGKVALPAMLNLTSESMTQDGVYLLEDGESILMWIGRAVNPSFLQSVFGIQSIEQLDVATGEQMLGQTADPLSTRVLNIIQAVRQERPVPYMVLHIIRHGDPKETRFFASLIEDRTVGLQASYSEFLQRMGYRPAGQQQQAPPGGMAAPPGGAAAGMPPQMAGGAPPQMAQAPPALRR